MNRAHELAAFALAQPPGTQAAALLSGGMRMFLPPHEFAVAARLVWDKQPFPWNEYDEWLLVLKKIEHFTTFFLTDSERSIGVDPDLTINVVRVYLDYGVTQP